VVSLDGQGGITAKQTVKKEIPVSVQRGARCDLFDFIAAAVEELTKEGKLGFTFSFPLDQKHISSGILLKWTKNFDASNVVGHDVCELLNEQLVHRGMNIKVNALINDTVGTQLSGAYQSKGLPCLIGLILGTGSNTCFWENSENVPKWNSNGASHVIINMESGNFGSRPDRKGVDLPMTEFDIALDDQSINVGHQLMEKQVSGMYLGELCRLAIRKYMGQGAVFTEFASAFGVPYGFETADVSTLEEDNSENLDKVQDILTKHGVTKSTKAERKFVQELGHAIGQRSAQLAAIQIAAILKHIKKDDLEVAAAIDGSVFQKFPQYPEMMKAALLKLMGHNKVHLQLAGEGSGFGAALASFLN